MLQPPPARPGMREDEVDTPALLIDLDAFEAISTTWRSSWRRPGRSSARMPRPTSRRSSPAADGAGRGRPVRAEGGGGRGAGLGRHSRHPGEQRGGRRVEAGAACGAGAASARSRCAPTMRHRWPRSRRRRRMPASACRCWWRSMCGAGRCGVAPGPAAVELAKRIAASKHLMFGGLQAYHGSAQHRRTVGGAPHADRQRGRCVAPHRGAASPAGSGMSHRRRRGHRHVPDRIRRPASITKSRPAATCSWTPTMRATWTRRARRSAPSAIRCSCWQR